MNKLIIARLPLALPPYAQDPQSYARGVHAFAQIYHAFEESWHGLIDQTRAQPSNHSGHDAQLRQCLADLIPSGLWRAGMLKADLEHLSEAVSLHLDTASNGKHGAKDAFVEHIRKVTAQKPHTLIAYAWIMYMAIFSGGRWIRQQLVSAGSDFWHASSPPAAPFGDPTHPVPGFSLFYFEGDKDGENIKSDFKARLENAEALLSSRERQDIIDEAGNIFNNCIGLVDRLDVELATAPSLTDEDEHARHAMAKKEHVAVASPPTTIVVTRTKAETMGTFLTRLFAVLLACLSLYVWTWARSG